VIVQVHEDLNSPVGYVVAARYVIAVLDCSQSNTMWLDSADISAINPYVVILWWQIYNCCVTYVTHILHFNPMLQHASS
jgi:hypothetical protein